MLIETIWQEDIKRKHMKKVRIFNKLAALLVLLLVSTTSFAQWSYGGPGIYTSYHVAIGASAGSDNFNVFGTSSFHGTTKFHQTAQWESGSQLTSYGNASFYTSAPVAFYTGISLNGGTNTFSGTLNFNSDLNVTNAHILNFSSHGGGFYMSDDTWIRTYGNKSFYQNSGTMRTDGVFQVGSGGSRFHVTSGGNVGIGDSSPSYKLDVNGTTRVVGDIYGNYSNSKLLKFQGLYLTWSSNSYGTNTNHSIRSTYGDTAGDDMTINSYDNIRLNVDTNNNNDNSYFEIGQHTTGTGNILFRIVSPTGYVGIGTTSPAYKLDVSGDIRTTGWIRSTGDYGLYNQNDGTYLYSDDGNYFKMRSDRGLRIANKAGTTKGYLYHDNSNGFGFVDSDGNWSLRLERDSYTSFAINGSEKMRILSDGSVGIGTTTPSYELDVNGTINATALLVGGQPLVTGLWTQTGSDVYYSTGKVGIGIAAPEQNLHINQSTSAESYLHFTNLTTGVAATDGMDIGVNANEIATLWNRENTDMVFGTNGVERLRIKNDGRIGVGTGSPGYALDINGTVNASELLINGQAVNLAPDVWGQNGAIAYYTAGNVGIGVDSPTEMLEVNGKVKTREVNVTLNGWPDYVFEPTYSLPTLKEVETHIQKEKHLPNVPSAADVKESGVNLGEMQSILLKKIEELTLYTIEMKKEVDQLKKENKELSTRLKQIEEEKK